MIEDIRNLKPGALIKVHDALYYKLTYQHKFAARRLKTNKNEIILLLKLVKQSHEVVGVDTSKNGRHYYLRALRNGELVDIFFHSVSASRGLPEDIEKSKYASYAITVVKA